MSDFIQTGNHFLIHQLIEMHSLSAPHNSAVSHNRVVLTYSELNEKANQLAHYLRENGVTVETLVGVCITRSLETIISILAILKAGGVYIPIDPDYPQERINFILSDSNATILLTERTLLKKLSFDKTIICIDTIHSEIESHPKENLEPITNSDSLAYVLYTSGSTGTPKGVMVTHGNLIHAYKGWESEYKLHSNLCHLQMANFSFDVFSGDFVRALCSGGKLVLCPREYLLEPKKLYELLTNEKIGCAEFVPTVLRRLIEYLEFNDKVLNFINLLICGSDNWSIHEYRKLQKLCNPQTRVINSYGLTEATIDSTYFEDKLTSEENFLTDHSVPIGKPFPKTTIFLLDEKLNPVPTGNTGEIYISGAGLARGYLNQPELTIKKFIIHTIDNHEHRLYRTGDLGRYLSDGNIVFIGRIDNQIKLRGMRIELSDIENVLNCHSAIRESLVVLNEDEQHHKRLIAYIVFEHGLSTSNSDLRKFLQEKLPHYMIPALFIHLDSLPLTPNGKLDRQALKNQTLLLSNGDYIAPKNHTEKKLAQIWEELLGIEKIGVHDHFYELGGDSLLLARLKCNIEENFLASIPLCEMTKTLTVAELAKLIDKTP